LKPHQSRYWLNHERAEDPEHFDKAVQTICALYHHAQSLAEPGVHIISTDEKTGIQAIERAHPTRPMQPGCMERVAFEDIRHGTQTLIANVEVATGNVMAPSGGPTRPEAAFVAHMERTIALDPVAEWVFVVDRLNTHQSASFVRLVAQQCGIEADLGVKGGITESCGLAGMSQAASPSV
jgi:hypothetical protein